MHEKPEAELIAFSRQGDQTAIAELFRRHYASSLRLARSILRTEDESQDAVQVAYCSAFQHLHSFREDASFKTWITRIVVNCCLIQLREPRRQFTWVHLDDPNEGIGREFLASPVPTPEKSTWCRELTTAFSEAISRLPKNLREAYVLYSVSGFSVTEVAAALGLTVSAAKARVFRARAGVRHRLEPVWAGAGRVAPRPVNARV